MGFLDAIQANLASPAILFFVLGLLATALKSDLRFPEPLYLGLTIYLLVAIGFKGGVAVSVASLGAVWLPALAAVFLGAAIPLWSYPILRRLGGLPAVDAAAIGAHYGSVSAVTFIAATNYLVELKDPHEGFATAFLAAVACRFRRRIPPLPPELPGLTVNWEALSTGCCRGLLECGCGLSR